MTKQLTHLSPKSYFPELLGETMGTFILVLFGCGSVAAAVLFNAFSGLLQIAMIWGVAVTLAIYLTRHLSNAHLNPAVSIAMVLSKRMPAHKLPTYFIGQFTGAFIAALCLYGMFGSSIFAFEVQEEIIRGSEASQLTARIFGEFYAQNNWGAVVSMPLAMAAEALGTFLLLLLVFALTEGSNIGKPSDAAAPLYIGLTVAIIITLVAPFTQAGLNPARDFSPRMVTWIFGWGDAAFPDKQGGFFWVYMLSPILGASIAAYFFTGIIEPAMLKKKNQAKQLDL